MNSKSNGLLYPDIARGTGSASGSASGTGTDDATGNNQDYPDAPSYPGEEGGGDLTSRVLATNGGKLIHPGIYPNANRYFYIHFGWDYGPEGQDIDVGCHYAPHYANGYELPRSAIWYYSKEVWQIKFFPKRRNARFILEMHIDPPDPRILGADRFRGGAPCIHRAWLSNGSGIYWGGYLKTPPGARSQKVGSITGGARFIINVNRRGVVSIS